jgi:toluene monooxygenase system protein D
MENAVGPVLSMSDEIESVVAAIHDDNPGTPIEVVDRGSYVRVQSPGYMRVTRDSLERRLGRDFEMRELELMLTAFAGRIRTSSDDIVWELLRDTDGVEARNGRNV